MDTGIQDPRTSRNSWELHPCCGIEYNNENDSLIVVIAEALIYRLFDVYDYLSSLHNPGPDFVLQGAKWRGSSENKDQLAGQGNKTAPPFLMYEGGYIPAKWQPPSIHADTADFLFDELTEEDFKMPRGGATVRMIESFSMSYSHSAGLSIVLDDGNRIYLGWNQYVDHIASDVFGRGERWVVDEVAGGSWTAWKIVRNREGSSGRGVRYHGSGGVGNL
jgi:hypothetical protein